jgi:murein DD-endopeptidase MepM/ murein hydrolase activator NlpD
MNGQRIPLAFLAALAGCAGSGTSLPESDCGPYPAQRSSAYVLPYPPGTAYRVIQGNCTPRADASHAAEGAFQHAYDFDMEVGAYVTAARGGMVAAIEERYTDANRVPGAENYVFVRHGDGTIGRYFHLTRQGALVNAGEQVHPGDTLGLSGDTGNSSRPHLHFDVALCPEVGCETRPVTFRNTTPHPEGLITGTTYAAIP